MNRKQIISVLALFLFVGTEAQILNRIKNKVEDKVVGEAEKAIEPKEKSNKKKQSSQSNPQASADLQAYKNYDFVPGDQLIYYYDMANERDAEIPGRMLLNSGNAEIQTYQNEKVLFVPGGESVYMAPQIKGNSYLPVQFTVEFDVLSNGSSNTSASEINLYFREKSRAGSGDATAALKINLSSISGDEDQALYAFECYNNDNWVGTAAKVFPKQAQNSQQNNWRRVAVYVNDNIGKLYVDQHRLAVANQLETSRIDMMEIEVISAGNPVLFRNFRIASGGDDAYNQLITDGKFIAYGIQFDVNKAVLKPESMGSINEMVRILKENPDLKFEIGGHTDSDGSTQRNDELSLQRAETVKSVIIGLGIDGNRLTTQGFGSSKPLVPNDSPENKARNRRVEFVKN